MSPFDPDSIWIQGGNLTGTSRVGKLLLAFTPAEAVWAIRVERLLSNNLLPLLRRRVRVFGGGPPTAFSATSVTATIGPTRAVRMD